MNYLSLFAVIFCTVLGIVELTRGNILTAAIDFGLAAANLYFVVR